MIVGTRSSRWGTVLACLAWLALVLAAYALLWGSYDSFLAAIDHTPVAWTDFRDYYYPMGQELLTTRQPAYGYIYPAAMAVWLVPFAQLPETVAAWLWGAGVLGSLAALVVVAARWWLPRGYAVAATVVTATSFPVLHAVKWGQVGPLICLGVLVSWLLWRASTSSAAAPSRGWSWHRFWAGAVLAVPAVIKIYPALFAWPYLLRRSWSTLAGCVAGAAVLGVVIPSVVLTPAGWVGFDLAVLRRLRNQSWDPDTIAPEAVANAQSTASMLTRWAPGLPEILVQLICWGGAAVLLATVWRALRRPVAVRLAMPVVLLTVAVSWLVKTSWHHYFPVLGLGAMAVWAYAGEVGRRHDLPRAWWLVRVLPLVAIGIGSVAAMLLVGGWHRYAELGLTWWALTLTGVAAVLTVAVDRPTSVAGQADAEANESTTV
ncbi:glycosyltransferase family 87 protein [Parenemella sanctibonifatiensis]|uniref:glycosyltransferase family 87 protein n=1 Tax=Parenemella sanctibonifatiensis TaxID=2016505 RepID=UPI0011865AF2|nr:glycosyltransferase family 87 protein [Parenemella sanctibonifatiensis]